MSPSIRSAKWTAAVGAGAALALAGWLTHSYGQARPAPPPKRPAVATVGSLIVSKDEFEARAAQGRAEYERRQGSKLSENFRIVLDRQILESLIRGELLVLEAQRRKVPVSEAEAEQRVKQDPYFQENGAFSPTRYNNARQNAPAAFKLAMDRARSEIAARKLTDQMQQQIRPEEARLRASAERALTRATLDVLMLPRVDFSGQYAEPTEREVLAYYRAHPDEFRRGARAELTVVRLHGAATGELRALADSMVAALRGGGSVEDVTEIAAVDRKVTVLPDNFPGYWKGNAVVNAAVFRQQPGTWLDPIAGEPNGWLVARVDQVRPAGVAPLREVAIEVRKRLRDDRRLHYEEREARALYEARKDSLRTPAYRIRYAVVDTSARVPDPSASDLDHYYRGHLADYTSYDAANASVTVKPFAEVRDLVRARWLREQRLLRMRSTAERLLDTWAAGNRDRVLERSVTTLRELGPIPFGAPVDTGAAGLALSDTLSRRGIGPGVGVMQVDTGVLVYQIHELIPSYAPEFDQIKPVLLAIRARQRHDEDLRGARELFDRDPQRFATGNLLHFTRMVVQPAAPIDVKLTRDEVERYYRDHLDKFSAPEMVHARHILVTPHEAGAAGDREAQERADDLLRRARAGEDFGALARSASDDPATRDRDGDLGFFARGTMLPPVERAAFALRAGEISDVVRSEVGYHIVKVVDYVPLEAEPLERIYANVGAEAAFEKSEREARRIADSLYRAVRTPKQALVAGRKLNLYTATYTHVIGSKEYPEEMLPMMARLERTKLGTLYPGISYLKGTGAYLQWPDSITPPRAPTWEQAQGRALDAYHRDAWRRALDGKIAELDSLRHAGWPLDSLAAMWGGWDRVEARAGNEIARIGSVPVVDSLVFGGRRAAALSPGETSGWVEVGRGLAMIRLAEKHEPGATELAARIERERRLVYEHHLFEFFEDLKRRFPVRILDPRLREISLPPPPVPPAS